MDQKSNSSRKLHYNKLNLLLQVLLQVRKPRMHAFMERQVTRLVNGMDSARFKATFRLLPHTYDIFESIIGPLVKDGRSSNGKSLRVRTKLLIFLNFCAGNICYVTLSNLYGIIITSIQKIIEEVLNVIEVKEMFIKFPTEKMAKESAQNFSKISGFPPIIFSIIDGTHIPVTAPRNDAQSFRNRKDKLFLNPCEKI